MKRKTLLAIWIILASIFANNIAMGNDKKGIFLLSPKTTFEHYCAPCHGNEGKGDGQFFPTVLNPRPRDLTDIEYMKTRTDEQLFQWISKGSAAAGGKSNLCPPWGHTLSEEKINGIIAYLKSLTSILVRKELSQSK